mmetsp:Transcript_58438/g.102319  ORF Transcript_58438/g.102319 Transcript_58438/m.102319 type:complete len:116 (+) Transcript_58438:93-440(+)
MPTLGETGVSFDTIAREWRCKYTYGESGGPTDSTSLKTVNALLEAMLPKIKAVKDVKEVKRVMCGGCQDFKVITSFPDTSYDETVGGLEAEFLDALGKIEGISSIETQTYTFMTM